MNFYKKLKKINVITLISSVPVVCCLSCNPFPKDATYENWHTYLGDQASTQYSSLNQIRRENVDQLKVAWTYHTGDADPAKNTQIQTNPIIVDGILYGISPKMKLFALDAAAGREIWVFNPFADTAKVDDGRYNIRGVTMWREDEHKRIIYSAGPRLYAVDAKTGKSIPTFGENGSISVKKGLGEGNQDLFVAVTSPGIIYRDLIIVGSRVSERHEAAPGYIRAYNVRNGDLEWMFHTIPHPGEPGSKTWKDPDAWKNRYVGGANNWSGMSLDTERGIVYVPTGSPSPDFYGAYRRGENLYANSLLALDAATGKLRWHFQMVHHDLWDRDLPAPPNLLSVKHKGKLIDAIAQTTKTGHIFLFNRETGKPLFGIEEFPVPTESDLEGEEVWPTQPIPVKPAPLMRLKMHENDINPYVSEMEQEILREKITGLKRGHMFEPGSLQGTLNFPGTDGGTEWGGSAVDPETGILYVNHNEVPWILQLIDTKSSASGQNFHSLNLGKESYLTTGCVACHGMDRKGSGRSPSLIDVENRRSPKEILALINQGQGMMPSFKQISETRKKAMVNYLISREFYALDSEKQEVMQRPESYQRYVLNGYKKFQTQEGYPAISPPWGRLTAVDLNTGEHVWQIPLGEYPELRARGIPVTGTENYGGAVVTKGGLVFIGATPDKKFKAYDKSTGELLWETDLPFAGFATPSIYQVDKKQYIVIACGGGKLDAESGDVYLAFSLP